MFSHPAAFASLLCTSNQPTMLELIPLLGACAVALKELFGIIKRLDQSKDDARAFKVILNPLKMMSV